MEKVYCSNCEYLGETAREYKCIHSQNTKAKDTWLKVIYGYMVSPHKLNKHNDCSWYKNKPTVMPKKGYIDPEK